MTELTKPTELFAKVYRITWIAMLSLLAVAAITVLGNGVIPENNLLSADLTKVLVIAFTLLIPASILIFSILASIRRFYRLAVVGFIITAITILMRFVHL